MKKLLIALRYGACDTVEVDGYAIKGHGPRVRFGGCRSATPR